MDSTRKGKKREREGGRRGKTKVTGTRVEGRKRDVR